MKQANNNPVQSVQVVHFHEAAWLNKPDLVATEEPLEIRLGFGREVREQRSLSVTMRSPGHDFELALGFLFTEGIVQSLDDIESVKYCEDVGRQEEQGNVVRVELKPSVPLDWSRLQRNFYTSSSCGVCGKTSIESVQQRCEGIDSDFQIHSELIVSLPDRLRNAQMVFQHTGGLHAVGVFAANGELLLLREDVGRHNALDKAIGALLLKKQIPATGCVLLVSGRASFELVQKAAMAGFAVMAAVGAPSSLAVSLAEQLNMTLIGFLRGSSFNIYSAAARIKP
ncbi:MAG: formate dehydrogenase accessory sulfurtransferase FdhD [Bacteroidota bacterium]